MINPNPLNTDLDGVSLARLAQGFLDYKKFQLQETVTVKASCICTFDIFLSPGDKLVAILIKDYRRSCGFNVIHHFSDVLKAFYSQIKQAIVISNQFSFPARSNAKELNIELLPRGDLVSIYRINQIPIPANENLAFSERSHP
jgi:hypothetical protein